jgi:hypothetical protein
MLFLLISPALCHGQSSATTSACMPSNSNPPDTGPDTGANLAWLYPYGPPAINPNDPTAADLYQLGISQTYWAPNSSGSFFITGNFPVSLGCPNVFITAAQAYLATSTDYSSGCYGNSYNYPDTYGYCVGPLSTDVSLSNLTYVSPIQITFTAAVGSPPTGEITKLVLGSYVKHAWAWYITAEPPPPPGKTLCGNPTITSITPTTWSAGKPSTVTITGQDFSPGTASCIATTNILASATTSGDQVPVTNVNVVSSTQITATLTPAASEVTQPACLAIENVNVSASVPAANICSSYEQSGIAAQIVNCVPTITSISPSTWFAGKSYDNVVIKGTNFVTTDKATAACPLTAVNIVAADGSTVPVSGVTVVDKTKITLTVAPPATDTTESANVTAANGSSISTPATQTQILGNQISCDPTMNCTQQVISTTDGSAPPVQNVVVGQPIILNTLPLPNGITATKTTWTVGGTNIGGYAPTTASATVTPTALKTASLNTFWVYPLDGIPVTYQYCVTIPGVGNQCSLVANATFNVSGPTATITPNPTSWSVTPQMSCPTMVQFLFFGYADPVTGCNPKPLAPAGIGISFSAALSNLPVINGTVVNGTAEWVQVITKESLSGVSLSGVQAIPSYYGPGLDNTYPYLPDDPYNAVTTKASDSPNNSLNPLLARETRRFKADMYYLWQPQISGSIFVPLGYVEWNTSGTGVQHPKDSPPWSLALSGATTAVFNPSSDTGSTHGYPTWSGVVMNTNSTGNENDDGEEPEEQQ